MGLMAVSSVRAKHLRWPLRGHGHFEAEFRPPPAPGLSSAQPCRLPLLTGHIDTPETEAALSLHPLRKNHPSHPSLVSLVILPPSRSPLPDITALTHLRIPMRPPPATPQALGARALEWMPSARISRMWTDWWGWGHPSGRGALVGAGAEGVWAGGRKGGGEARSEGGEARRERRESGIED